MLEARYRANGWTVRDTHRTKPFDAIATKGRKALYGEVAHARKHPGQCILGVVSNIEFLADGTVDPVSGTLIEYQWDPDAGTLRPAAFRWTP